MSQSVIGTAVEQATDIIQNPDLVLTPPSEDIAVQLVNRWFGEGWHSLLSDAAGTAGGSEVLYAALKAFNLVLFSCVVMVLLYTISNGLVGSAQHGQTMGQKYDSFWTSFRSCFSFVTLAPLPLAKGLCLMQVIVLSLTYLSFGGASWIHSATMDQLNNSGGVLYYNDSSLKNTEELGRYLFSAMTIQKERNYDYQTEDAPIPTVSYDLKDKVPATSAEAIKGKRTGVAGNKTFMPTGVDTNTMSADMDPASYIIRFPAPRQKAGFLSEMWDKYVSDTQTLDTEEGTVLDYDSLGSIKLDCPKGISTYVCKTRLEIIQELIQQLDGPTSKVVDSVVNSKTISAYDTRKEYENALKTYVMSTRERIPAALKQDNDSYAEQVSLFSEASKQLGWASTGWWYWTTLRLNQKANELVNQFPKVDKNVDFGKIIKNEEDSQTYEDVVTLMNTVFSATGETTEEGGDETTLTTDELSDIAFNTAQPNGFWGYLSSAMGQSNSINSLGLSVLYDPIDALSEGEEPILYLQAKGHLIIDTIVSIYIAKLIAEAALDGDGGITSPGGLVSHIPFVGGMIKSLMLAAMRFATLLAVPLLFVGLTWAYYLPIVPFVFFTMAVIGTLIQFAEAMVAAPVWAAAHALPEGEGFAGNHGRQGYFLFFNILLRPPLLMVGFILSIVMFNGIGKFIATGYQIYTGGMQAGYLSGPITYIMTTVTFTVVILVATHKLFSLVTWLPDNVIRWVGQMSQSLGEHESEGKTQMIFGGVMNNSQSAVRMPSGKSGGNVSPRKMIPGKMPSIPTSD